ncbi:hypothetical protein BDZ94DRAFT_892388 [Collybia nuda]|uniref:Uncharacterized protein n=1 Tax=Collybia nuda TaxID=64659 RepID=A0A9P5Y368_9AGAR|nr:hypothetical protein BDZ94DRAFT_892388 [Collybia nuda]
MVHGSSHVTLPLLKTLKLTTEELDWDGFLDPVSVPSLENLSIIGTLVPPLPFTSFIIRSRCPIRELFIFQRIDQEGKIDGDVIHSLFHHLSTVTDFSVTWLLQTSAIRSICNGAFPNLESALIYVYPKAFGALLDIIDSCIDKRGPQQLKFGNFHVICYPVIGFEEVRERYRARFGEYEAEGLTITAANGDTGAFLEEEDYEPSDYQNSDEDYEDYYDE